MSCTVACRKDGGKNWLRFLEGHDGSGQKGLEEGPVAVIICGYGIFHCVCRASGCGM